MRFLVECTYVYEHPKDNSGIQRVVRNVINHLGRVDAGVECIPVMMHAGQLYRVISLTPLRADLRGGLRKALIVKLEHALARFWWWHSRFERLWPLSEEGLARRLWRLFGRMLALTLFVPIKIARYFCPSTAPAPERAIPFEAQAGDQLLMLDSSWHADFFPLAEGLKAKGVGIISVIYDLIPLTHPQFCDEGLVKVFDRWFDWVAKTADGFMAISQTISRQVAEELERRLGPREARQRWHGHFYLGADLDLARDRAVREHSLASLFQGDGPVYLMVSTIEPRKNHQYLLDAFELLWEQGSPARLCIIGKVGWKCQDLIRRIQRHPEWKKRLFMFNQADDSSLEYAYANSTALVFPSHVEGFGLPLVEAMQRGLPVMASDIPVFREVGGDFMAYFDLQAPSSLAELILEFEKSKAFPARRSISEWSWIDWLESSRQLIRGSLAGVSGSGVEAGDTGPV
ncbi:glycosyltransferase family 4 protein [Pseudomonas alcaligenes]|uniref:glycosyltransferase family 4 protein n=1 Tax=Aquipseudomonas alcaligenes TaxID=43263 RepID=UPI00358F3A77